MPVLVNLVFGVQGFPPGSSAWKSWACTAPGISSPPAEHPGPDVLERFQQQQKVVMEQGAGPRRGKPSGRGTRGHPGAVWEGSATRGAEGRDRLWAPPHSHSLGALRSAGVHMRSSHLFLPGMEVSRADHLQNHPEAVSFLALGQAQSCSPCSALTPRYQTSPCSPALTPPSATTKLQLCL